jgi:hypothetical protein
VQVLDALFPHIVVLSQNKFASNVVEKLLLHCTSAQRADIVEAFLHTAASGGARAGAGAGGNDACGVRDQSPLEQMMQDQYGNYVVQKTLEVRGCVRICVCGCVSFCSCFLWSVRGVWGGRPHGAGLACGSWLGARLCCAWCATQCCRQR